MKERRYSEIIKANKKIKQQQDIIRDNRREILELLERNDKHQCENLLRGITEIQERSAREASEPLADAWANYQTLLKLTRK